MKIPTFEVPITQVAPVLSEGDVAARKARIIKRLKERDAVLIAHYYTGPHIQALAEESGGIVSDSLEMARFGREHSATTLVVAGVRFMGETAKILSPHKTVLMPTRDATCSLDLGCPADEFELFCKAHPDRAVVVYANTSAAVKALADWVVTSSNALDIINHLDAQGEKILWAPDRYLGRYLQQQTGADMVLWQGACVVHEEFKAEGLQRLKAEHPEAGVLVHPESPEAVIALADVVGSTSRLIQACQTLPHDTFIVATDQGIFYKMQHAAPNKTLIAAPTAGHGATCRSCGHCPWMAMNTLENLEQALTGVSDEITIAPALMEKAKVALQRMVDFQGVASRAG